MPAFRSDPRPCHALMTCMTEFFGRALANPDFDWTFFTTPQPELNDQGLLQSRGKMLGGSSGLNFMAYGRASAKEYDAWEEVHAFWRRELDSRTNIQTPPSSVQPGGTSPPSSRISRSPRRCLRPRAKAYSLAQQNPQEQLSKPFTAEQDPYRLVVYTTLGTCADRGI